MRSNNTNLIPEKERIYTRRKALIEDIASLSITINTRKVVESEGWS